ncbi:MAG: hypothetical protein EOO01_20170 [Chitinophagaceae bacterium]|nr:MAG: hypothetical protein EOO01_20170 [Chitinophagaceae bacterium]
MLAAIYALIINQSLKLKERKTARLKIDMESEKQTIKRSDAIPYHAVSEQEFSSRAALMKEQSRAGDQVVPALYQEHPFHPSNKNAENSLQDFLYPVNSSYTPAAAKHGSK